MGQTISFNNFFDKLLAIVLNFSVETKEKMFYKCCLNKREFQK